jgi:hypothetical protein
MFTRRISEVNKLIPQLYLRGLALNDDLIDLSLDRTEFSFADLGDNTVTLTVTDDDGLTDSCQATVTVVDTTPPDVSVSSPEDGKTYVNTQGKIPVKYTTEDVCDPDLNIAMSLDDEPLMGDSIDLCGIASGEHTLIVRATDNSGNKGEASATFYVEPQALESFIIEHMTINWAPEPDYPGGKWSKWMFNWWWKRNTPQENDKFSISGRLRLPDGYSVEDLNESATLTVTLVNGTTKENDTVHFQKRSLGRNGAMWMYWGDGNPPGEGIDITKMTIWWAPQSDRWAGCSGFNISGVFELPEGIGKDTEPASATVTLELPVTTEAGCGSLLGEEVIKFNVTKKFNLWSYYTRTRLPYFRFEPGD